MRPAWLVPVLLLVMSIAAYPQTDHTLNSQQGRISGIALNEEGQPMAGVSVCTSVTRKNESRSECRVSTDKNGHFEIDQLAMGTVGVSAAPEGYQLSNQHVHSVKLTNEEPAANITIRLGQKAEC